MKERLTKSEIEQRVIREVEYYLTTSGATVRSTAKVFKVSKSTVHKDLTERINEVNLRGLDDKEKVQKKLKYNQRMGRILGGEAMKNRYLKNKNI